MGIAPDEIDTLFEAFVQTESGRQAQEGTGLGLPISRQFVQLMGGEIRVESEVGRGTVFAFDMLVEVVSERAIEGKHAARRVMALEPKQPSFRILIVDDKANNRLLLRKLLAPLGFELREAANGQEAVEIWQAWQPHLIWMDIRMPVMDGYEATKRIKAARKGQLSPMTIPAKVIALTASTYEEERVIVLNAGCDDFMRKPFHEADIFEMMHKHLGVRYIYEETKRSVPKEAQKVIRAAELLILPAELLAALEQASKQANMLEVNDLIVKIGPHDAALADGLKVLAQEFDYGKILDLIQEAKEMS